MRLLQGHENSVQALAYSPDGATLASASDDCTVRLWDAATGEPGPVLRGHRDAVLCVAFAGPDEVLSCGFDGRVLLWDLDSEDPEVLTRFSHPATALAVSRDGRLAAAGADCGHGRSVAQPTLRVIDRAARGELERSWFSPGWPAVWSVALSPAGDVLAAGLSRGEVRLWGLPGGAPLGRLENPYAVQGLAFAPGGKTLAALTGPEVRLWDVEAQSLRRVLGGERHRVWSAAFTPDGRTLATGCWDSAVRLWDLRTGAELRRYDWGLGRINAVAVAPDGLTAAAAGMGRDIFIWDLDE